MGRLKYLLGVLGLLLSVACASRSIPPTSSTGTLSDPAASIPKPSLENTSPPVSETAPEEHKRDELLVEEAKHLQRRGAALFREGRVDEARTFFRQSLETLKGSGLDFFLYPHVELEYYDLLARIQEVELEILIDPAEMQIPSLEQAPLDEIADLNLFTIDVDPQLEKLVSRDLLETRFDIPVVLNPSVVKFLNYYRTRGRKIMEEGLRRSGRHLLLLQEIFRQEGVPLDLVYMANVESLFKPRAYSRKRARGLWQFISGTGKLYGLRQDWWIDERSSIDKSTRAAARFLKELHGEFQDWNLAMAAYNVGGGRIRRIHRRYGPLDYWAMVKRRLLPRETRHFVPSILASIIIFHHPERYGFYVEAEEPVGFDNVALKEQVDLRVVAESIAVPLAELLELNPELRRGITPFDYSDYRLKVPKGKGDLLERKLASLPAEKKVRFRHHRVRRGETLSVIAGKYSSSIGAIAQVNRIRNVHRLREGQDLIIPLAGSGGSFSPQVRLRSRPTSPTSHTVRRGDSLARIARLYRVNVEELLVWNNLNIKQLIYPGQRIRILAEGESTGSESR